MPLSHDLLEVIGRAIADLPVLIVIAYRPPQIDRLLAPRVSQLHLISPRSRWPICLRQMRSSSWFRINSVRSMGNRAILPQAFIEKINLRAEGNPFYIEELLNFLHDRNIDPQHPEALEQIDLPNSLHSLILSRIDQLSENQKSLLKVASVIGRLFRAAILWGMYNQFGDRAQARNDLDTLSAMELTPMDTPEPELAYLFKHILTQEVAYETLSFATRGQCSMTRSDSTSRICIRKSLTSMLICLPITLSIARIWRKSGNTC
jgi:adenylate cyclase